MIKVRIDGQVIPLPMIKGADGKSAYQYAVESGFKGTEQEFINLLIEGTDTIHHHLTDTKAHTDIRASINSIQNTVNNISNGADVQKHNIDATAHNDIRALINGLTTRLNALTGADDETLDGLAEIIDYIKSNKDLIEAITNKVDISDIVDNLTTAASNKVLAANQGVEIKKLIDALYDELDSHTHSIEDITGLKNALNDVNSSHGIHVTYSVDDPVMDGVADPGSAPTVPRSDHKHPTDISRASKKDFDSHVADETKHPTSTERVNWDKAYAHSQDTHAPSNAQPNQNAFSNIKVGNATVVADNITDTVEFAGDNITIIPDITNDKITFSVSNAGIDKKGLVQLIDSVSSDSITTAATPNSVKLAYDLANEAKDIANNKADEIHGNHVPKTETADNTKFLRNDNTWQVVTPANIGAATNDHTHPGITDETITEAEIVSAIFS